VAAKKKTIFPSSSKKLRSKPLKEPKCERGAPIAEERGREGVEVEVCRYRIYHLGPMWENARQNHQCQGRERTEGNRGIGAVRRRGTQIHGKRRFSLYRRHCTQLRKKIRPEKKKQGRLRKLLARNRRDAQNSEKRRFLGLNRFLEASLGGGKENDRGAKRRREKRWSNDGGKP